MFRGSPALVGILLMPLLSGCDPAALLGYSCTSEARPYLVAHVRDARSGAPAARGAGGRVLEGGEVTDTFWINSELVMQATGFERAGRFDVLIRKPGYEDWIARDVRVREGRCHVETRTLQVRLVPAG